MKQDILSVRYFKQRPYIPTWHAMRAFTETRTDDTLDEVWLLEHDPVFTQGQNGKEEHILNPGQIPIVKTDRGGQVTYHGPGQLMLYALIDIKRRKMTIRDFVCCMEKAVIAFLKSLDIEAYGKRDAPGVYLKGTNDIEEKICSIGLRIKRGSSYHGIAFNVAMDLEPFNRINPCGFSGLKMTQLKQLAPHFPADIKQAGLELTKYLSKELGYTTHHFFDELN